VLAHAAPPQRAALMSVFSTMAIDALAAAEPEDAASFARRAIEGLRCATRASALARAQTEQTLAALANAGIACEAVSVSTKGDDVQDRSLAALGGEGVFVKELERALEEDRADFAVHSCKDLPATAAHGMQLAAFSAREDARDVLCSEKYADFASLPAGARVGTSSPRRRTFLQALRDDLRYDDIRGNVDTRLNKLRNGDYDAIVLAAAGLHRLNTGSTSMTPLPIDRIVPAAGQGIIAIECRAGDRLLAALLHSVLNVAASELAATAERAFLAAMQGGCSVPIGAHAVVEDDTIRLAGAIAALDAHAIVRDHACAPATCADAAKLGRSLALTIKERGGAALLAGYPGHAYARLRGKLIVLPRTQERPSRIAPLLRSIGARVIEVTGEHAASAEGDPDVVLVPSSGGAAIVAGYLRALRDRGHRPLIAAMGPASASAIEETSFPADVVAPIPDIDAFITAVAVRVSNQKR